MQKATCSKWPLVGSIFALSLLAGCVSGNFNQPDNQPTQSLPEVKDRGAHYAPGFGEETVIGISFSGGGMRASAFAYGAMKELAAHESRFRDSRKSLIEDVVFVAGVSGGSLPSTLRPLPRSAVTWKPSNCPRPWPRHRRFRASFLQSSSRISPANAPTKNRHGSAG